MNYDVKCQLLIIGDSTVGKTSILSCFANGTFNSNYLATVGLENFTKDEIIDDKTIRIKIWDTAGQERYKSLTKGFFRNAEGVMLVYDVTNSETYENLKFWLQSIKNNISSDMGDLPIIIIGNKIDLEEREVQFKEAEKFWKEQGYQYFETSAKTGENVDKIFEESAKEINKKINEGYYDLESDICGIKRGLNAGPSSAVYINGRNNSNNGKKCCF